MSSDAGHQANHNTWLHHYPDEQDSSLISHAYLVPALTTRRCLYPPSAEQDSAISSINYNGASETPISFASPATNPPNSPFLDTGQPTSTLQDRYPPSPNIAFRPPDSTLDSFIASHDLFYQPGLAEAELAQTPADENLAWGKTYKQRRGAAARQNFPRECGACGRRFLYADSAVEHWQKHHTELGPPNIILRYDAPKRPMPGQPRNIQSAKAQNRRGVTPANTTDEDHTVVVPHAEREVRRRPKATRAVKGLMVEQDKPSSVDLNTALPSPLSLPDKSIRSNPRGSVPSSSINSRPISATSQHNITSSQQTPNPSTLVTNTRLYNASQPLTVHDDRRATFANQPSLPLLTAANAPDRAEQAPIGIRTIAALTSPRARREAFSRLEDEFKNIRPQLPPPEVEPVIPEITLDPALDVDFGHVYQQWDQLEPLSGIFDVGITPNTAWRSGQVVGGTLPAMMLPNGCFDEDTTTLG